MALIGLHVPAQVTQRTWLLAVPLWLVYVAATALLLSLIKRFRGWPVALLIGGLLSNIFNLFLYGAVMDYIPFGTFYTNLADICIVLGCILLVFQVGQTRVRRRKEHLTV